jgi:hypothetical protein
MFFKPDVALDHHEVFASRFWRVLQALSAEDLHPRTDVSPDDPLWEFSFDRHEMFVVGLSPTYHLRPSRNLGPGMILVFQPRVLFTDPATGAPISLKTRHALHERMRAYDGMEMPSDIRVYGDPATGSGSSTSCRMTTHLSSDCVLFNLPKQQIPDRTIAIPTSMKSDPRNILVSNGTDADDH